MLLTPQPNQSFFHVQPGGNSYHSGPDRQVIPLTPQDETALIALGCTLVVEVVDSPPDDVLEVPLTNSVLLDYTER